MGIDYNNLHLTGEYNRTMVHLKEEELNYLERICKCLENEEEDNDNEIKALKKENKEYKTILFNALENIEQNYDITKHEEIYKVTLILSPKGYDAIRRIFNADK